MSFNSQLFCNENCLTTALLASIKYKSIIVDGGFYGENALWVALTVDTELEYVIVSIYF